MERYRTTLILGAVLLVLVGVIFFMSGRNPGASGTPTATPTQYVWEETNPVVSLTVVSDTGRVALEKDVTLGSWKILEPVQQPADLFAVSGIADSMQKLAATYTLTETNDLAEYGLDKPMTVTVEFSGTTTAERTLLIGAPLNSLAGYYAKTPDSSTVYVIANTIVEPLRSWLTTPPVMQPTATPAPQLTVLPPATPTPLATPTAAPDSGVTPTIAITATTEITTTAPGVANPTTPEAATPTP